MAKIRPLYKSVSIKIIIPISQSKHKLWVLKRTVSLGRFILAPKTNIKNDGKDNICNFTLNFFAYVDL